MPIMWIGLPVDSTRLARSRCRDSSGRDRVEGAQGERQAIEIASTSIKVDAELIFRADANRLGYLEHGRGMARYYRDHGILPPRYLAEGIRKLEFTNFDLERVAFRGLSG
jgi:hypothetical protein